VTRPDVTRTQDFLLRLSVTVDHDSLGSQTTFQDQFGKELGHIRCEHAAGTRLGEDLHRGRKETEAESVAHIICKAVGLDSQAYSDAYVLGWANGDMNLVKACAETILRVAKRILADLTPTEPAEAADDELAPTAA